MAADYAALQTEWAKFSGTTQSKLDQINAETVTGSIPTSFKVTSQQLFECLDPSEWLGLITNFPAQTSVVRDILGLPNPITITPGGPLALHLQVALQLAIQSSAHLGALAVAQVQPWWQAHGFSQKIGTADLTIAGGLT